MSYTEPPGWEDMDLLDRQFLFAHVMAQFILWVYAAGYTISFGETWRSPQEAARDAAAGIGILHSLHTERLAEDLNIFKNRALIRAPDYKMFGDRWKTLHPLCCWGGDFDDFDHFSITHGGRR